MASSLARATPSASELHPQPDGEGGAPDPTAATEPLPTAAGGSPGPGQPKYVLPRVVAGTFGNLQGLRLSAECGPFTHILPF